MSSLSSQLSKQTQTVPLISFKLLQLHLLNAFVFLNTFLGQYGRCYCRAGYEGHADCRTPDTCPRDVKGELCGGSGVCLKGTCYCAPGYWGDACGRGKQCKSECSKNGFCNNGKCQCDIGFQGTFKIK